MVKGTTGPLVALVMLALVGALVLMYGLQFTLVGGPGSPGESVVLRVNDYSLRQGLLMADDYLGLSLRYSGYQACLESGRSGGREGSSPAVWWDRGFQGPARPQFGADIAARAARMLSSYSSEPYRFMDTAVALPASWNVTEKEGVLEAAGGKALSVNRGSEDGSERLELRWKAEVDAALPTECVAQYAEGARLAALLGAAADAEAAKAAKALLEEGEVSLTVTEAELQGYVDPAQGLRRMAEAVVAASGSTLAEHESKAAEKAGAPSAPESELSLAMKVVEKRALLDPSGCSLSGKVPEVKVRCSFGRSAEVLVEVTVTDEKAAYPVWDGEIADRALPLTFRVRGRADIAAGS